MKRLINTFIVFIILFGCGAKEEIVNLEKDGLIYTYGDALTFYYPKGWELTQDEMRLSIQISNSNTSAVLYFDVYSYIEDNPIEEMLMFYIHELEEQSIIIDSYEEILLESGQDCYLIKGENPKDDGCFVEVVMFLENKQYIYTYIAEEKEFETNEENMLLYLKSLAVDELEIR